MNKGITIVLTKVPIPEDLQDPKLKHFKGAYRKGYLAAATGGPRIHPYGHGICKTGAHITWSRAFASEWLNGYDTYLREPKPQAQEPLPSNRIVQLEPSKPKRPKLALWICLGVLATLIAAAAVIFILEVMK
jgi:hypothetical protein